MKEEHVTIKSTGEGFVEALSITDSLGKEVGLDNKEQVRLRLLTEETIGLLRGIAGEVSADYSVKQYGREFTLKLEGDVVMDSKMHKQLLESSSSGENSSVKGFTGKLREMIATMVLPGTIGHTLVSGFSMGLMTMSTPSSVSETTAAAQAYMWSMEKYSSSVKESGDKKEWDTLERSIIANIADEIKVGIQGSRVEITVYKQF